MCEPECGVVTSYALNYRRNESSTFSFTGKSLFFCIVSTTSYNESVANNILLSGQAKDVRLRGGSKSSGQP